MATCPDTGWAGFPVHPVTNGGTPVVRGLVFTDAACRAHLIPGRYCPYTTATLAHPTALAPAVTARDHLPATPSCATPARTSPNPVGASPPQQVSPSLTCGEDFAGHPGRSLGHEGYDMRLSRF
jgi:hypothetical protein